MQNLVTVSHTLCTHVKGPKNFFGTLVPRPPSTPQRPWSTPSSLLVSTTATAYCTALPPPICTHFSQLSTRLHASSLTSASSTHHWHCARRSTLATSLLTHPIQVVLVSQQVPAPYAVVPRRHVHPSVGDIPPAALICVLSYTATSSFPGLAWPAMGLAVSPSRIQWPGTVCHLIAIRLCLVQVS